MYDMVIMPYNMASAGAKGIAKASNGTIKLVNPTKVIPKPTRACIRWGSVADVQGFGLVLNKNSANAVDKMVLFELSKHTEWSITFTLSMEEAAKWLEDGCTVIGRKTTTGTGGSGIVIFKPGDPITQVKVYTKYIKKTAEYRVHVVDSKAVLIQKKVMPKDKKPVDGWEVRSHDNGFIFQGVGIHTVPQEVISAGIEAINTLGLDFGGVDVIWNATKGRAFVLEVNSAPGLENKTIDIYVKALTNLIKKRYDEALSGQHGV